MKIREFYISGLEPAYGKQVNDFVKVLDLGMEGAFIPFAQKVTAQINDDVSAEQWARQPAGIKLAYEEAGCIEVVVRESAPEYHSLD